MIARPKISRNEWKPAEIGAFEVGNFALFCCPAVDVVVVEVGDDRPPREAQEEAPLRAQRYVRRRVDVARVAGVAERRRRRAARVVDDELLRRPGLPSEAFQERAVERGARAHRRADDAHERRRRGRRRVLR